MRRRRTQHQSPPRPGHIEGPGDALAVIHHALNPPGGVVALLLDRAAHEGAIVVVDNAPDTGLEHIVGMLLDNVAGSSFTELVLASMRPPPLSAVGLEDVNRWFALDAQVASAGIVLLDWFILAGDLAHSMAETSFSADRW